MMIIPMSITFEALTSNHTHKVIGILVFFLLWIVAGISAIGAFMPSFVKKCFPGKHEELC
jgi:cyanate permease